MGRRHEQAWCYQHHAVRRQGCEQNERAHIPLAKKPLRQKRSERMSQDNWRLIKSIDRADNVRAVVRQHRTAECLAPLTSAMSSKAQSCRMAPQAAKGRKEMLRPHPGATEGAMQTQNWRLATRARLPHFVKFERGCGGLRWQDSSRKRQAIPMKIVCPRAVSMRRRSSIQS